MNTFLGLLLFLGLLFSGLYCAYWSYKKRLFKKYYASTQGSGQDGLQFFTRAVALIVSWILISIVLAAPGDKISDGHLSLAQYGTIDEVCFLLDASASMRTEDTSIGVMRFQRAKEIITETIEPLGGMNISLVAFSGNPELIVPPTEDYLYFRILLEALRINEPGETGTNFLALTDLLQTMIHEGRFKKKILFVLLTDGEDTTLSNGNELIKTRIEALGVSLSVVALGTVQGAIIPGITEDQKAVTSFMQLSFLEMVAKSCNGALYQEMSSPIFSIVDGLRSQLVLQTVSSDSNQELFPAKQYPKLPLFASFFFILVALFMPLSREEK